jgi:hypothetical protein
MTKVNVNLKTVAKEIAESIPNSSMEFYLYKDGDFGFRQIGSFGQYEQDIIYKESLEDHYWRDGLSNIGLDINDRENWSEQDLKSLTEYIEGNLSYAVDRHTGQEIEWAEEQIEIDLDFPEELSEEDKKAYLEYLKKYKSESATDDIDDFTEEWNEEDRKAYIEFLKETELKFSTDKD